MITSNHRGHKIYVEQDKKGVYSIWKYLDDGTNIKNKVRPCPRCGNLPSKEGHDHCIANLPGVKYACCGHGVEDGYVLLENGKNLKFNTNLKRKDIIKYIKKNQKL